MTLVWALVTIAAAASPKVQGEARSSGTADLSGTWTLDTHLTDHPEQIARAIELDTGELRSETFRRGVESRPGGEERSGDRRPDRERERVDALSEDERKLLAELTRRVQFPPTRLTIAQEAGTVTITAGGGAPEVLRTDGKTEKQAFEAGTVERTAAWEGLQLRVAYEVGRAGALTYLYSIVPTTRQLLIRVNFERLPRQPGPFDVKLLFNRAR